MTALYRSYFRPWKLNDRISFRKLFYLKHQLSEMHHLTFWEMATVVLSANTSQDWTGCSPAQAEIIAVGLLGSLARIVLHQLTK